MFVRSLTAVGKLFLLISSLALGACSTHTTNVSHSSIGSTNSDYHNATHTLLAGHNYLKYRYYSLPKEDKLKQENAVFFALNNSEVNQITQWHNANTGSNGAVKVVMSYPQGGGVCRVIQSQIQYRGKSKNFTEKACLNYLERRWHFIR